MRITVVGLGIIGSVWADHWVRDGHQVRTWNRTAKPQAPGFGADLAAAVRDAELVAIVVADAAAVGQVLDVLLPVLPAGAVVAQHSTIGVDETQGFAARVRAAGGRYLDMPFTGSKPAAEARQVVYFVGDDDGTFPGVASVYAGISRARLAMGGVGRAAGIKLAMNLLIAGLHQAMAESFTLATRLGIPPETWFGALDLNVSKAPLADLKKPKYLAADWSPQFSVKHMHKDLRLALALAKSLGVALPNTATVEEAYAEAERRGWSDRDFSVLLDVVRGTTASP